MTERTMRPGPRTFDHFPADVTCPICGTNDDGLCVLIPIAGTREGMNVRAMPMHLACAVVRDWDEGMGMGTTWPHNP